jgi:hypothetical protein
LFCSIRHPLIIAPIGVQRQALLTERLPVMDIISRFELKNLPSLPLP